MKASSVLLLSAWVLSGTGGFPSALTRPIEGAITPGKKWSWPQPADFDQTWKGAPGDSYALVEGELAAIELRHWDSTKNVVVTDAPPSGKALTRALASSNCKAAVVMRSRTRDNAVELSAVFTEGEGYEWCFNRPWRIASSAADVLELTAEGAIARLKVSQRMESVHVSDAYLTDWTYAATLSTPRGKSQLLDDYAKNAPIGRCSQDRGPTQFASSMAERCWTEGDLACFLQLRVKIMGDQFARFANSNVGDAQRGTESARLETTGIDVDRFFRGLLIELPGERPVWLEPWRLSRAIIETNRQGSFGKFLEQTALDTSLDEYNRLRATETLFWLRLRDGQDVEPTRAAILALDVTPVARRWLEKQH